MTLGLWVKNYLYIPMGGNRNGEIKKMRNLLISMLIIGLWHGAGWTFVFWGGLHGTLLTINHAWRKLNVNFPNILNWGMTFLCVVICWVFFRAENFNDAINVLNSMADWQTFSRTGLKRLAVLSVMVGALTVVPNPLVLIKKFKPNNVWLVVTAALFLWTIFHLNNYSEFLYFRF